MFNKKVLAAAIVAATTVGTIAQVSAMELNEKGIGQALIGPIYYAEGSYKTEIVVVNTRTDAAVKAKVVLRSHKDSVEVLDFIVYLSPGDVWRGTVEGTGTAGEARIVSSDDSMRIGDATNGTGGKGGNETTISQALNTASTGNIYTTGDTNDWGHVDILGVYAIPVSSNLYKTSAYTNSSGASVSTVEVKRGMSKAGLSALFGAIDAETSSTRNTNYNLCTPAALAAAGSATAGVFNDYRTVSSISPCSLELTGLVTIGVDGSHRASYTMHAMNAGNPAFVKMDDGIFQSTATNEAGLANPSSALAQAAGFATDVQLADAMLVVANPGYNEARTANSHLTEDWGLTCASSQTVGAANCSGTINTTRSNLQQYDAAVARTVTSWEYDAIASGTTNGLVSFPSKYLHRNNTNGGASAAINFFNSPCGDTGDGTASTTDSPEYYSAPFPTDGNVKRTYTTYDNFENTSVSAQGDFSGGAASSSGTFPDEVNYLSHASIAYFSESTGGWGFIRYTNSAVAAPVGTLANPAAGTCQQSRFGKSVSYTGFPALTLIYKIGAAGRLFEKTQDIE
ncbi:MAG: hypothetical protein QM479_14085 [Pseudomonadota bacterium]